MGLAQLLGCFCGASSEICEPSLQQASFALQKSGLGQDGCQDGNQDLDIAEDLLRLQWEISALRGTGFSRLTLLLRSVALFASADASLFGVVDEGFVLLATSKYEGTHNSSEEEPDSRHGNVLQRVLSSQRPVQELSGSEACSTSTGEDLGAVCAVPLFGGPSVIGALLLEASPVRSLTSVIPFEGTQQHSQPPTFPIEQPGGTTATAAAAKKHTRQRLFSSPALLHQLGLAVSVGLGLDGEQLRWLARALHHVASCDTFNSLVWQLCEDVAAHVRRRFIVEAGVRAALLPRAEAPLGLLFHARPCSSSPSGCTSAVRGSGAAAEPPVPAVPAGASTRLSAEGAVLQPQSLGGHLQVGAAGAAQQPCSKLSSLTSRTRLSALATCSGAGTSDCGAASRLLRRPASTHIFGSSGTAPGRALTLISDALSASRSADPHHLNLPVSGACSSPLAGRATIVVQLPPHMASEAPAASLHAQAFPLKHALLQALAGAADGGGNLSGNGGGGCFPGACIEDVALYLQNVHNPSRDVCLLLGGTRGAPLGQPSSPRTPLATAPAVLSPLAPGSSGGGGGGPGGGGGALQSLVLVGLSLGDAVLALYLCFRKRLPGELLLAVRDSCNELLGEVFAGPVRAKLEGSLAPEFETLRATTPGHFAVLRSASVNGLLPAHRQGSHGTASLRVATRLIAPPRGSCGALLQNPQAMSGSSETGAAPVVVAVAVGAAAATEGRAGAGAGTGSCTCRLSRRTSMDLSCCSQAEVALLTAGCATATRGAALPRPVSFSAERGTASTGANVLRAANALVRGTVAAGARQASREVVPVTLVNDELISTLLAMRQSETAGGCCGSQQGEIASASIMTVAGVDAAAGLRQQLDLLVTSIQTTMTTEGNGAMLGFADDLESLELLDVLGHGGGGIVYRGRLGTQEVAVKVMELPDLDGGDVAAVQQLQALGGGDDDDVGAAAAVLTQAAAEAAAKEQLRARRALLRNAMEMAVQGRVSHPNLIQVYATYTNVLVERRSRPDGSSFHCLVPADGGVHDLGLAVEALPTSSCAIVAELADCGSLAGALSSRAFPRVVLVPRASSGWEQHPFQLDMRGVYMTLLDVALALRHLHALHLVHRDVKPANLLLKSNPRDPRGFTVKLADFGFVLQLSEVAEDGSRYVLVDQACGTVTHMAPELLPGKARVDASADVYSFGILMWELVSGGVRPFPHLHPDHIPRHVYKGARPVFGDVVPLTYRGLAQACWAAEPHRRPRTADLISMITAQMQELE